MQATGPSTAAQLSLFARNFFKHPKMLGSIIPSSRYLIRALLKPVDWKKARIVVEYGPGVGTISVPILKKLRADGKLVLIETNPDFVKFLGETMTDPRVHVFHRSAADVNVGSAPRTADGSMVPARRPAVMLSTSASCSRAFSVFAAPASDASAPGAIEKRK